MHSVVVIDFETGGTDPAVHPITQAAALAVDWSTLEVIESLEIKIKFDEATCTERALEVNHYDREVWEREGVHWMEARDKIRALMVRHRHVEMLSKRTGRPYKVAQLVGHNADDFDVKFLRALFADDFCPTTMWALDTLQMVRWEFATDPSLGKPENFKLDTLCQHLGIEVDGQAHDALADVKSTLGLIRWQRSRRSKL